MKVNLIEKESTLTTIPSKYLERLTEISEFIMCDALEDCMLAKEDFVDVDLGFGVLGIKFENNELKFRFRPSAKFEGDLISTIVDKQNSLTMSIESALVTKLTQTYKDLM